MSLLSASAALGLFALATALLVLWFLLRRRAQRVIVPSLAPWKREATRRVNPLWRELMALAMQIVAAGLICAALVQPELEEEAEAEQPVLAIVDGSASMAAQGRMAAAAEAARALGGGVALAGEEVRVLALPDASPARRAAGLARLEAGTGGAALDQAAALAEELGFRPVVLSDRADAGEVVGEGRADVAIEEVLATAGPGLPPEYGVTVRVHNHGPARSVVLRLETAEEILGEAELSLEADAVSERTWRMDPVAGEWVRARLVDPKDALAANDAGYGLLPGLRPAVVWIVGEGNRYLEDVLAIMPGLQVRTVAPGRYRRPGPEVDLVIFDRVAPAGALPEHTSVFIDPPPGFGPIPHSGSAAEPAFATWDYSHPLLRGVTLRHIEVARVNVLRTPAPGERVLAATEDGPAIVVREERPRVMVMGFDLTRSDFPLTIAFPQFIYNIVQWARQDAAGPPVAPAFSSAGGLPLDPGFVHRVQRLDAPGSWDIGPGRSALKGLSPGVYEVDGGGSVWTAAVNHPADEHAQGASGGPVVAADTPAAPPTEGRPRHVWMLLGAALLLLVEFGVAPR